MKGSMTLWSDQLDAMDPISLLEMEAMSLLNRQDSKYLFSRQHLAEVLEEAAPDYRVLVPGQTPRVGYLNRYFDTEDFELYRQHHNGKANRYKFRYRQYRDSGLTFFELKFKNNKRRTIKTRSAVPDVSDRLDLPETLELLKTTPYRPEMLQPALDIAFTRFTLINRKMVDRCTLDTGLRIRRGDREVHFPDLVICEVKQDKQRRDNDLIRIFERRHIAPVGLSKFCLGVIHLVPGQKTNRFKPKLLRLNRITTTEYEEYATAGNRNR